MIIGSPPARVVPGEVLCGAGQDVAGFDDPFGAMAELCRRPLAYRVVVLCLNSLYGEELPLIRAIKGRYPHVEVWLAQADGRAAALAEAARLGADGLMGEDGLHPFASLPPGITGDTEQAGATGSGAAGKAMGQGGISPPAGDGGEPLLTAEELRALLSDSGNPASSA